MAILRNDLFVMDNGDVKLRQQYDIGMAMETAQEVTSMGGGRMGTGSSTWIVKGYIPTEEWNWDIYLIEAKNARAAGDMHEYQKYMNKYFETHPRMRVWTPPKYYMGSTDHSKEEPKSAAPKEAQDEHTVQRDTKTNQVQAEGQQ